MKFRKLKIVDAFTKKPFSGNPAGVVLDASGMTDDEMQSVARELNLSETAFILPPTTSQANLKIRWFSILNEVPLCGHATIASFHALSEESMAGMSVNGQHYFRLETMNGILDVRVEKNFYETAIEFALPKPTFRIHRKIGGTLLKSAGFTSRDVVKNLPAVSDSYLYVPIRTLKAIEKAEPDYRTLAKEMSKLKVQGLCCFTLETKEKSSAVHSRFFAPNYGINEDPVTGSANGPLGFYLQKYVVSGGKSICSRQLSDGRIEFVGEQGDSIGRAGRVKIRLRLNQKSVEEISIAGEAVTILDAQIKM